MTYKAICDHIKDVAPQMVTMMQQLQALQTQFGNVQQVLDPVLQRADDEIGKLKAQSENIQEVVSKGLHRLTGNITQELQTQDTKHDTLIQHAQQKFADLETSQQTLVNNARMKFDELEASRNNFETQAAAKVLELDQKMAEVTRVINQAALSANATGQTRGSDGQTNPEVAIVKGSF